MLLLAEGRSCRRGRSATPVSSRGVDAARRSLGNRRLGVAEVAGARRRWRRHFDGPSPALQGHVDGPLQGFGRVEVSGGVREQLGPRCRGRRAAIRRRPRPPGSPRRRTGERRSPRRPNRAVACGHRESDIPTPDSSSPGASADPGGRFCRLRRVSTGGPGGEANRDHDPGQRPAHPAPLPGGGTNRAIQPLLSQLVKTSEARMAAAGSSPNTAQTSASGAPASAARAAWCSSHSSRRWLTTKPCRHTPNLVAVAAPSGSASGSVARPSRRNDGTSSTCTSGNSSGATSNEVVTAGGSAASSDSTSAHSKVASSARRRSSGVGCAARNAGRSRPTSSILRFGGGKLLQVARGQLLEGLATHPSRNPPELVLQHVDLSCPVGAAVDEHADRAP